MKTNNSKFTILKELSVKISGFRTVPLFFMSDVTGKGVSKKGRGEQLPTSSLGELNFRRFLKQCLRILTIFGGYYHFIHKKFDDFPKIVKFEDISLHFESDHLL